MRVDRPQHRVASTPVRLRGGAFRKRERAGEMAHQGGSPEHRRGTLFALGRIEGLDMPRHLCTMDGEVSFTVKV